jgi:ribosomal protein S18 acetylase RimI-like enzyme
MDFEFDTAENLQIEDLELSELLTQVYVGGGFTDAEHAKTIFESSAVRQRGSLIGVRDKSTSELAGVIILVPPESNARRLAKGNEVEIQLLGVKLKYRGQGLGKQLVEQTIARATTDGRSKIVLWTQETMVAAQRLYESFGFSQISNFEQNGRKFLVYALAL